MCFNYNFLIRVEYFCPFDFNSQTVNHSSGKLFSRYKPLSKMPTPAPTEPDPNKPSWVEVKQKGPKCVATTTADIPCKKPLKREF